MTVVPTGRPINSARRLAATDRVDRAPNCCGLRKPNAAGETSNATMAPTDSDASPPSGTRACAIEA